MVWFSRLCLFLFLFYSPFYLLSSLSTSSPLCHPDDTSALLQFKNSLPISKLYCESDSLPPYYEDASRSCQTMSWKNDTDCCRWDGVTCDDITGHVIGLNLTLGGLNGTIQSNSTLFRLTHLKSLLLSHNDFIGSQISSEFGRFENMMHLDLSFSRFSGQVAPEISYLSKLHTIDLSFNDFLSLEASTLKRIIENTTKLTQLFLSDLDMSSIAPISLMNLSSSLKSLNLSNTRLQGKFPEGMFRRPNLQVLNLNGNTNLSISFPKYNLGSPLKELSLSSTNIPSDDLTLLSNLTKLTWLDLYSNNFSGHIPWNSLNLERLTHLDLGSNKFIGHLPEICTNNSKKLCFPSNSSNDQLEGSLPLYLETLYLDDNLLNGSISTWLYSLPSLKVLYLDMNQFTGSINEFHSSSLEVLFLSQNRLHGRIPISLFQQVNLRRLDLSSNSLSGVVGLDQFSKLKYLQSLDLSSNNLSLRSNNFINYTLPKYLDSLGLSSCRIREFPNSVRALEYLTTLILSHNFLRYVKNIPWSNLGVLDISYNQLQGFVPIPPPSTRVFLISNNQLTGNIPSQICNASSLGVLNLSNNRLNGSLPPCLGNFSENLLALDLRNNRLQGMIPTFSKVEYLRSLNFNGNQLEGPLPQSLLTCKMLEVLDVGNNKINGSFPNWLESLPELQVLILRSNKFYGPIGDPMTRFPFQKLRIMDLSNNNFTGHLPRKYFESLSAMMESHAVEFGYIEEDYHTDSVMVHMKGLYTELVKIPVFFVTIDLSRNHFSGEIPNLIGRLKSLHGLNFSHNKLSGSIPPSLGTLSNLEWLDLSSNELVGVIPMQLADLTFLQFLKLAHNKLVGPIPRGKQFNTFENDSYIGNLGLCGVPLSKTCNNEQEQPASPTNVQQAEDDGFDWKFVWMGYISGLVIGISTGYIVLSSGKFDHWFSQWAGRRMWHKLIARLRSRRN
ncbi:hypothetical protein UlMin_003761 [Ulmus minor]